MKKMNFDLKNLKVDNFKSVETNESELNGPFTRFEICERTFEPELCTRPSFCIRTRPPQCPRPTTPAAGCRPTTPSTGCPRPTTPAAGCTRPPRCPRTAPPQCPRTLPPACRPTRWELCETRRQVICP